MLQPIFKSDFRVFLRYTIKSSEYNRFIAAYFRYTTNGAYRFNSNIDKVGEALYRSEVDETVEAILRDALV